MNYLFFNNNGAYPKIFFIGKFSQNVVVVDRAFA